MRGHGKIFLIAAVGAVIVLGGGAAAYKPQSIARLYGYLFYDEPYLSRTFANRNYVLTLDDPRFKALAKDPTYDDKARFLPDFSLPPEKQITAIYISILEHDPTKLIPFGRIVL